MIYRWTEDIVKQVADDDWDLQDQIDHILFHFNNKKIFEYEYSRRMQDLYDGIHKIDSFEPAIDIYYERIKYNEIDDIAKDIIKVTFERK